MPIVADIPKIDIRPAIEIRERFESRLNRDFSSSADDARTEFLTRLRPSLEAKIGSAGTLTFQYQASLSAFRLAGKSASLESQDLSVAQIRISLPEGSLTAGRQRINVGSERLIGSLDWANVPRSYDGFRIQMGAIDAFAFRVGVALPKPENADVYGATYRHAAGEALLVYKSDETGSGRVRHFTLSQSGKLSAGKAALDYETALQWGTSAGKDHRAWAAHVGASYQPGTGRRAYAELNLASGGHRSDKSETFDNLYPTNHKFYGSMDMQGWKNVTEFAAGYQHALDARSALHLHGHAFRLMDAKDAWYGAGGAPNKGINGVFKDATGAAGKDVGFELDFEGTHKVDASTTLAAGIGMFTPGKFIRSLNGGSADRQTWFFLQFSRKY